MAPKRKAAVALTLLEAEEPKQSRTTTMAPFNDTLTRYLSIRDCIILERVSHFASDIAWLCYSRVTDLSAFGITDQMTHNAFSGITDQMTHSSAFSDLPRHCTAFFRRFDCNKLTSLRVPWNPQTIAIENGISCSDAGKLLEKCPNLVEMPPIDPKFEDSIGFDNMLSRVQTRLYSLTLYSDLSCYEENQLLNLTRLLSYTYFCKTAVSSTGVCHLEIAVKIPLNIDYAIDTALEAFIRFVSLRLDISAVRSLKVFIASDFTLEDRRECDDLPYERRTSVCLSFILQDWSSLEELSVTIEHATTDIALDGLKEVNLDVFPALRTFRIVPLYSTNLSEHRFLSKFHIEDRGVMACMPVLRHLDIGSSIYNLHDAYENIHSVKTRKEVLERTVLILNQTKTQNIMMSNISKEVAPHILAHIGESGCLRKFAMENISVSPDTLLKIMKQNRDLQIVSMVDCDGIGDELFTLLAQAQLRNLFEIIISPCSSAGIRRYMKWRIRQIERGRVLATVDLVNLTTVTSDFEKDDTANLFVDGNLEEEEVRIKGRINIKVHKSHRKSCHECLLSFDIDQIRPDA